MIFTLLRFILGFFRTAVSFFSGTPGKISIILTALGSVVYECRSFVGSLSPYFSDIFTALDGYLRQLALFLDDNQLFMLFSHCLAFDVLLSLLVQILGFLSLVLSFLFVSFLHVLLLYFGLKFGYSVYKFLLKAASNGFAHA